MPYALASSVTQSRCTSRPALPGIYLIAAALCALLVNSTVQAQHSGDIGIGVVDGALQVYGPIGGVDTNGAFYGQFGDTGFEGFTSNPGFDAFSSTLPAGRIGFQVRSGLRRWDSDLEAWRDPTEVGERLRIWFITLSTIVEDGPIAGFDLAVQPDGGWHRHLNFELLGDAEGNRLPGMYRLDLSLYSSMGLGDSNEFTIAFDYDATAEDVEAALASLEPVSDCLGDLDDSGEVAGSDIGLLLSAFGSDDPLADLDNDGGVTGSDIGLLLSNWGPCQ